MIRRFLPFDVARYALLGSHGSGNRVHTLHSLGREAKPGVSVTDVPGLTLSLQSKGVTALTWADGNDVAGIVAARARSGPRAWEVTHLFLAKDDANQINLLATLSKHVARRGGERVFIRLLSEDPLVEIARGSGFIPCGYELLYRGRRKPVPPTQRVAAREKTAADDYGIFRLYGACTPRETRSTSGMTFGQWAASRERTHGRSDEFVHERDGEVKGWLKTIRRFGARMMLIMVHPDEEPTIGPLIDYGLERLPVQARIFCLVQDHQKLLQHAMWWRGFEVESEYVTLVRSMVAPVRLKERRDAATITSI